MSVVELGRFLVPGDSRAALAYTKENLISIRGRRSRLFAIAGKVRVPQKKSAVDGHPALDLARSILGDSGPEWVVLRDYAGLRQRNLVFYFDGDGNLHRVVKTRPVDAPGPSLTNESEALRAIRDRVDDGLRRTMPEVIAFAIENGHEVLALSALPGRPLDISMQRSLRPRVSHAAHLAAAGAWLGRFHAATRAGTRTAVHGDYWTRNLLFDRRTLRGVVDWEGAAPSGSPWEDVFTLPLLYTTDAPKWLRSNPLDAFKGAFTGRGALGSTVSGYFAAYSAASGVSHRAIGAAFEDYLLEQASRGRNEETAWKARYSWRAMLRIVEESRRSVFSS